MLIFHCFQFCPLSIVTRPDCGHLLAGCSPLLGDRLPSFAFFQPAIDCALLVSLALGMGRQSKEGGFKIKMIE
jgi:hypothetical protein